MEVRNLNKKNFFSTKVKTKSLTILLVTFLLSAFVGTLFVGEASAIPYTQYTGTLDGAGWALRIPDPWNGMLVLLCHGQTPIIPNALAPLNNRGGPMLEAGFAVAASNFGKANLAIAEGVESTYKLTNYIIENYGVTGKIFLFGASMGGAVVLLLGEKYPDIYSGVLDMFGLKDLKTTCIVYMRIVNMADEELTEFLAAAGTPVPPMTDEELTEYLEALRSSCASYVALCEDYCGGTPETNPTAYEDVSPTYHANIQIPVITVHGTADMAVPYVASLDYQTAVAKAYRSNFYRLYPVPGGSHGSADVMATIPAYFNELVEWSNELTGSHDWPMFGCGPQRCGYSTSNAPNTNQTLWINPIIRAGGTDLAVVDGKLYVGDWWGVFHCLNATSGEQIWNYTTGAMILSAPSVADGRVYVGSHDNNTYCFDAVTGAKIWSYKTGGGVGSSPAVVDWRVYVGSNDGKLYCFRADYGQVEWKFTTGAEVSGSVAVADGKLYFGSFDRKVYCLDAASGALIWSYTTGNGVRSTPTVADGRVYVGSLDGNIYCLDAATGTRIWSYTTGNPTASSPALAYGKIYVGSNDNNVYCLDALTGAIIWNYTTGNNVTSSPAVADGKVYVGSWDYNIYCLDAANGALIWSYTTNGAILGGLAVANGVAYAVPADGNVYAFSPWSPIPESLTIGVMLLLSTVAVIVSIRYYRKRPKWENW